MNRSSLWAVLCAALAVLATASMAEAAETGFGPAPLFSATLTGDFSVASSSTRQAGALTAQSDPFGVTLSGIPAGATIVKAYANWSYQSNLPGTSTEANIVFNGTPISGSLTGSGTPDLNWGFSATSAYTADVTSLVSAAGGNGLYTITGAVDDAVGGGLGEGFSLLTVWSDPSAPLR